MRLVRVLLACLAALAVPALALAVFTRVWVARFEAAFPPQGRFVAVDGGRIHVTERRPAGPVRATIVLLHGASGNQADVMLPLGDRLAAKGFRVIAPDRPGHGWSDRVRGAAASSPAVQARILRAVFEAMGVRRAIVVGHSLGATLAVTFALDEADFTQGLVLLSPADMPWEGGVAWYNTLATTPVLGALFRHLVVMPIGLASIDGAAALVFAPNAVPRDYLGRTGIRMVLRPKAFLANAEDVVGLNAFVHLQAPRMRGITAPTAIVTGDTDAVVSIKLHSFGTFDIVPNATLTVLPGVGHSPHQMAPDRVVAAIVRVAERAGL